jgi:hypothetical protein
MTLESVNYATLARRASAARPGVVLPADAPTLPNFEANQQKLRAPKFPPLSRPGRIDGPFRPSVFGEGGP